MEWRKRNCGERTLTQTTMSRTEIIYLGIFGILTTEALENDTINKLVYYYRRCLVKTLSCTLLCLLYLLPCTSTIKFQLLLSLLYFGNILKESIPNNVTMKLNYGNTNTKALCLYLWPLVLFRNNLLYIIVVKSQLHANC